MPRIQFEELKAEFKRVLMKKGCDEAKADLSAQLMTETSCDGVYSHGVNRFPRVVEYIDKGYIDLKAQPEKTESFGAFERWNGNLGLGNVNAKLAMDRAIDLAREFGIPIRFAGIGERPEDLRVFDAEAFVDALLSE